MVCFFFAKDNRFLKTKKIDIFVVSEGLSRVYATAVFSVKIEKLKGEINNFHFFRKIDCCFDEFYERGVSVGVHPFDFFDAPQINFRDNYKIVV